MRLDRRQWLRTSLAGAGGAAVLAAPVRQAAAQQAARPVRLSSNENPLGLGAAAREAILEAVTQGHRYPGEPRAALIQALAQHHGVAADHIQIGTGSSEILQMVVHAADPAAAVIVAQPTFEDVPQYATNAGRRVVTVPLRPDWSHDLPRMRAEAQRAGSALVFVCNPNNPTGTLTSSAELEAWIAASDARTTFVVDEAYFEFAEDPGYRSAAGLAVARGNVVVVRTFSKIHGMAGLRLGYALAQPATIRRLRLWACNNNANVLALAAARAALGDQTHVQRTLDLNRAARALAHRTLDSLGLAYLPSHTNFVMHRIGGADLGQYISRMRERGVNVGRPFPPLTGHNRVSLGTLGEMEVWAAELRGFRQRGWV